MCGYADMRMCGCADVQMVREFMVHGSWQEGSADVQMCGCGGVQSMVQGFMTGGSNGSSKRVEAFLVITPDQHWFSINNRHPSA